MRKKYDFFCRETSFFCVATTFLSTNVDSRATYNIFIYIMTSCIIMVERTCIMQKDSVLGLKIAYYRKLNGLTQEELAEKVGVSTQAVSKWEQQTSCPDIMLLPMLANIFNITIDELFGLSFEKESVYRLIDNLPWTDDEQIRIALYSGRKLIDQSDYECTYGINVINFVFRNKLYNINGVCKFVCSRQNK